MAAPTSTENQQQTADEKGIPPDPDLVDDVEPTAPPAADLSTGPEPVTDLPPADIRHPLKYDTKRNDIVAQFKASRGKAPEGEDEGEGPDEPVSDGDRWAHEAEQERQDLAEQAESVQDFAGDQPDDQPPPAEPQVTDKDLITLKVDGEERQLTLDEMRALAQKYLASDNRLDQARELLQEARALKQGTTQPPAEPEATEEPEPSTDVPSITPEDEEKLSEIVSSIQAGDSDEGRQALVEFMEMVRPQAADPTPDPDAVSREIARHQVRQDIKGALAGFRKNHPDLANDEDYAKVGASMVAREMRKDMLEAGIPEEDIDPLAGNPEAMGMAYRNLKEQGHELRSYDQLFEDVAQGMRTKFNLRPPASNQQTQSGSNPPPPGDAARTRQARKRAAGPQPRAGGPRSPGGDQPTRQQPKSRLEIINEQRKARGYSVAQR